jgi:hypothetical protein
MLLFFHVNCSSNTNLIIHPLSALKGTKTLSADGIVSDLQHVCVHHRTKGSDLKKECIGNLYTYNIKLFLGVCMVFDNIYPHLILNVLVIPVVKALIL